MGRKTYILDTNVLIHDPESMFCFQENEVVIPFEALEELDKLKKRYDHIGHNARQTIRHLGDHSRESRPERSGGDERWRRPATRFYIPPGRRHRRSTPPARKRRRACHRQPDYSARLALQTEAQREYRFCLKGHQCQGKSNGPGNQGRGLQDGQGRRLHDLLRPYRADGIVPSHAEDCTRPAKYRPTPSIPPPPICSRISACFSLLPTGHRPLRYTREDASENWPVRRPASGV